MAYLKVSPEADFLTYCCRERDSTDWAGIERRACAVQDWQRVVQLCERHKIAPLLLSLFEDLGRRGIIPDWAETGLTSVAMSDIAIATRLRAALRDILTALDERGLEVIVLKGAALVALAYGDPAVRPSDDIDLLCREEDYGQLHNLLESLGYQSAEGPNLPPRHSHEETYFERHYYHPDGHVHVELHLDGIKLGVRPTHSDSIWARATGMVVEGAASLALAPDDQVLMLSVHLHRHGFSRLIWLKDIDLLVRRYREELDWEMILAGARAEGAEPSLWYTFQFVSKMLGTPFPGEVMSRLRPNPLIRWALSRIWPESSVLNLRGTAKRRAVQFSILESWRGMIPSLLLMGRRREKMAILVRRLLPFP